MYISANFTGLWRWAWSCCFVVIHVFCRRLSPTKII